MDGNCFFPAILHPVSRDTAIFKEEQFGPVCPVLDFEDFEEVLTDIAESDYGQQVSIFTRDAQIAGQCIDHMGTRCGSTSTPPANADRIPCRSRAARQCSGYLECESRAALFSIRTLVACLPINRD